MQLLRNLFGKKAPDPEHFEEVIGKTLLNLRICTAKVVVANPEYGDTLYASKIIVSANDILQWVERNIELLSSQSERQRVIVRALRLWLRGANESTEHSTALPAFARGLVKPNVSYFVKNGQAELHCPICDSYWREVSAEDLTEHPCLDRVLCTEIWRCPAGHELYRSEKEINIFQG